MRGAQRLRAGTFMNEQFDMIPFFFAAKRRDRFPERRQPLRRKTKYADNCGAAPTLQAFTAQRDARAGRSLIKRLAYARARAGGIKAVSKLHRYAAPAQKYERIGVQHLRAAGRERRRLGKACPQVQSRIRHESAGRRNTSPSTSVQFS